MNHDFKTLSKNKRVFHICSMLTFFEQDGQLRQRHINVLLETSDGNITKQHLNQINSSGVARLAAENDIPEQNIKDLVILNISVLGQMTPEVFSGEPAQTHSPVMSGNVEEMFKQ